jgi:hypothetical protein
MSIGRRSHYTAIREVDADKRFVSNYPHIVSRRNRTKPPGPNSASEPSAIRTTIRPETTWMRWLTWQLSVPTIGLTHSDQRHPGWFVTRIASTSPKCTSSILLLSKERISSGASKLFFNHLCHVVPPSQLLQRAYSLLGGPVSCFLPHPLIPGPKAISTIWPIGTSAPSVSVPLPICVMLPIVHCHLWTLDIAL